MIPQDDPYIAIGVKRSSDASILNFLFGSVESSYIFIPNFRHCFGFISYFSILFPNYKPCPNSSINTSSESSSNVVTSVHIFIFNFSIYYGRNGEIVHSSEINYIGIKFSPKKWVSAWLSISVYYSLQITWSLFLINLLII